MKKQTSIKKFSFNKMKISKLSLNSIVGGRDHSGDGGNGGTGGAPGNDGSNCTVDPK